MGSENSGSPLRKTSTNLQSVKWVVILAMAGVGSALGYFVAAQAIVLSTIFALFFGLLFRVLVPKTHRPMVPACAIQMGHGFSVCVGIAIIFGLQLKVSRPVSLFDIVDGVVLVAIPMWLAFRPTWSVCAVLALYQTIGIAVEGHEIFEEPAAMRLKFLIVHVFWRFAGLIGCSPPTEPKRRAIAPGGSEERG